jgi:hypothetical protein
LCPWNVGHPEFWRIGNYKQALADCQSSRTQRQVQFYFVSNCNCSHLIVKYIELGVFLAILDLKYRTMYWCFQNVICGEPVRITDQWHRVRGSHTAIAWFIAFVLDYLWQFGFSFIQHTGLRSIQNAFTVNCAEQLFTLPLLPKQHTGR